MAAHGCTYITEVSEAGDGGDSPANAGEMTSTNMDGGNEDAGAAGSSNAGNGGVGGGAAGGNAGGIPVDGGNATDAASDPVGDDAGRTDDDAEVAPDAASLTNEIETVAFYDRYETNASPAGPIPTPLLLFEGGVASRNVGLVLHPIDVADDIVEHPQDWPAWRRGGAGFELESAAGWMELFYTYECAPLAEGTTLTGTFQFYRDVVLNPMTTVRTIRRYRFNEDGTFETCETSRTVVVSDFPIIEHDRVPKNGTYEIGGYKIRFDYENEADANTSEESAFFYDPTRPMRLWLGASHYPTPTDGVSEICKPID
jgi:hypothetical protein